MKAAPPGFQLRVRADAPSSRWIEAEVLFVANEIPDIAVLRVAECGQLDSTSVVDELPDAAERWDWRTSIHGTKQFKLLGDIHIGTVYVM